MQIHYSLDGTRDGRLTAGARVSEAKTLDEAEKRARRYFAARGHELVGWEAETVLIPITECRDPARAKAVAKVEQRYR